MTAPQRREQILQEATRIIGQRGYFGFTIQEVADSCGITQAGLLHHVGTKDQLLTAVLEARDTRDITAITAILHDFSTDSIGQPLAITLPDAITVLHQIVARNAAQPDIVRLYSVLRNESLYEEHPSHDFFRERDRASLQFFGSLFAGKVADHQSFARHLLALMGGLEEQWLRTPDEVDLVAEWDRGIAMLLDGAPRPS
ncbi:MAG: helix-turn-helix domain-containing protein [Propionicimonas sp.]